MCNTVCKNVHSFRKTLTVIVFSLLLVFTFTSEHKAFAQSDETVIIAASDWQSPEGDNACSKNFGQILQNIKNDGITHADGFLFCGDYDYDGYGVDNAVSEGIAAIKEDLNGFADLTFFEYGE